MLILKPNYIIYINLAHREDRKQHVITQLDSIGINTLERFNAIKLTHGALGCSRSHLNCLLMAKERNWSHVLIVEDDILFLNPTLFKTQLNKFLTTTKKWDVVLFAGNNIPPYTKNGDHSIKVSTCQTAGGYLVKNHYFDELINNFSEGMSLFVENPTKGIKYAVDKYWFSLQLIHKWYLIMPLSVTQLCGYSDIEKSQTNYTRLMLDVDKKYLFKKK